MADFTHTPAVVADHNLIRDINLLHAKVREHCAQCGQELSAATMAAWEAGHKLNQIKALVLRKTGPGGWGLWVQRHFEGTIRTAQRYMLLAKTVPQVEELKGYSLRQAYLKLGITTAGKVRIQPLPAPVYYGNRFRRWIIREGDLAGLGQERREALRRDLRPVFEWMRQLYQEQ